jgi:large subunit ribosomal protein L9
MNVILLKDVDKIGLRGDVVSVARGYARNYLFPRNLAEEATDARVAELRKRESQRAQHEAKTADQAQSIAETLTKTVLRFDVKAGPTGSLFGSVTPTDIADEIWRTRKIRVDRRKIDVDNLKRIGRYDVPIDLFEGVRVEVKTMVVPEGGELPSDEELEAMAATEAAEQAAAAPEPAPTVEYEEVPEPAARTQSPAEAALSADEPAPEPEPEPEWRADADAALRQE